MRPQEFLTAVRDRAEARLPAELRGWRSRIVYATLQTHYGNPHVHYEVWLVRKTGRIEIGLHFEADRDTNHAWATLLATHADELREAIGPDVELDEWTPSWTRLHETLPLGPLDDALCDAVAERLAAIVSATGAYLTPSAPAPAPALRLPRPDRRARRGPPAHARPGL